MRKTVVRMFILGLMLAMPAQSFGILFSTSAFPSRPCTKVMVEIGASGQMVELATDCLMIEFVNHKALSPVEVTVQIPEEYEITASKFSFGFSGWGNPYWVSNEFSADSYCYQTNFAHIFVYLHGNLSLNDVFYQERSITPRFVVRVRAVN